MASPKLVQVDDACSRGACGFHSAHPDGQDAASGNSRESHIAAAGHGHNQVAGSADVERSAVVGQVG